MTRSVTSPCLKTLNSGNTDRFGLGERRARRLAGQIPEAGVRRAGRDSLNNTAERGPLRSNASSRLQEPLQSPVQHNFNQRRAQAQLTLFDQRWMLRGTTVRNKVPTSSGKKPLPKMRYFSSMSRKRKQTDTGMWFALGLGWQREGKLYPVQTGTPTTTINAKSSVCYNSSNRKSFIPLFY